MGQGRELTIIQNHFSIPKAYCLLPCRKRNLRNYMCKKSAGRYKRTEQISKDRITVFLQSHSLLPMENFCLHTNRQGRSKKLDNPTRQVTCQHGHHTEGSGISSLALTSLQEATSSLKTSCFTHSQKYRHDKCINQEAGRFNGLEPFLLIYSNFLCVKISMHEQLLISNIKTSRFFLCLCLVSLYD